MSNSSGFSSTLSILETVQQLAKQIEQLQLDHSVADIKIKYEQRIASLEAENKTLREERHDLSDKLARVETEVRQADELKGQVASLTETQDALRRDLRIAGDAMATFRIATQTGLQEGKQAVEQSEVLASILQSVASKNPVYVLDCEPAYRALLAHLCPSVQCMTRVQFLQLENSMSLDMVRWLRTYASSSAGGDYYKTIDYTRYPAVKYDS
jgi:regulator of replication initiation timing